MSKKKYHSRKFLNKKEGMAAIEITASYTDYHFDCDVAISDCYKKVNLDLNMWNPKCIPDKLAKLDLIISELNSLRTYLEEAAVDFKNNHKSYKDSIGIE
jgi:hypothetical protein